MIEIDISWIIYSWNTESKTVWKMCGHCLGQILTLITIYSVVKICTRLKKIMKFRKGKPRWDLENLYAQRQEVQDALEKKLGALGCESGNVEGQWNNIKKCVLGTMSDLVGKFEMRARKLWITQEMISKMDERRKWKNVNNKEGRKK